MHFLYMILIGLIVGALAKFIMPGNDPGGIIVTIIIGILGAVVAGWLGRTLNWYNDGEPVGFLASLGGAILLLAVYRMVKGKHGR